MAVDDLLADRQTDAGAGIGIVGVQALEDLEHALALLRGYADAVISHPDDPVIAVRLGINLYLRRLFAAEFDRVADQVLQHLGDLARIGLHFRQLAAFNLHPGFLYDLTQIAQDAVHHWLQRHRLQGFFGTAGA